MTEQETTIFNRVIGFGVHKVEADWVQQGEFMGTRVVVTAAADWVAKDFFFPDYANMSDAEMAEVVANNLREELWKNIRPSN